VVGILPNIDLLAELVIVINIKYIRILFFLRIFNELLRLLYNLLWLKLGIHGLLVIYISWLI